MAYSFNSLKKKKLSWHKILLKIIKRSVVLMIVGISLNSRCGSKTIHVSFYRCSKLRIKVFYLNIRTQTESFSQSSSNHVRLKKTCYVVMCFSYP